jgi:DNA-binding XRE family transcriptional regulator
LLERFPRNQWLPPLGSSRNELEATRKARSTEQRTMAEIAARIRAGRAQADEIVRYFLYEQQLRQDRVELLAYALGLATGRPDSRAQIERELIMERARLAQLPNVERETLAWIEGLR